MESSYERFMTLFKGLERAYGKYVLDDVDDYTEEGEKRKGHGVTTSEDVLPEHYEAHLNGHAMLGIIPIMDNNKVRFSAIDIDDYGLDIPKLLTKIRQANYPFPCTRSKSGGLHVWVFFNMDVPAKLAQSRLREVAASLGYPSAEVFPKQDRIGPNESANWINLPWFDHTKTDRFGWDADGNEIHDLVEWLDYAESKRITSRQLQQIRIGDAAPELQLFSDGPPCLQTIVGRRVGQGQRDTVMFNIACYAARKWTDENDRRAYLTEMNDEWFDPPMSTVEIEQKMTSAARGEYNFQCDQAPMRDVCNRGVCVQRRYGVGGGGGGPVYEFGPLFQHVPVTHEGQRMDIESTFMLQVDCSEGGSVMIPLSGEELSNHALIRKKCIFFRIILPPLDGDNWRQQLIEKMRSVQIVEEPEVISGVGRLRKLIYDFLSLYGQGTDDKVEILHGKAWLNAEDNTYWFKSDVFTEYLEQQRFKEYNGTALARVVRNQFGFETDVRRRVAKGKDAERLWTCPAELAPHGDSHLDAPDYESTF